MIFRVINLCLVLFCSLICSAQTTPGAKQIALSNSDIALSKDVFAIFSNPAGLSQLNYREIGVYYSPSPFGLSELANGNAAYIEPIGFGSFALGFQTYGFELYRENKFFLGFSSQISERTYLGLSAEYHSLSIKNYGNANAILFNLGLLYKIIDELGFGFSISNFTFTSIGNSENQLPTIFKSGISYSLPNKIILNIALEKEIDFPLNICAGMEYPVLEYFYLRTGIKTEPTSYSCGIGIIYSYLKLDYAVYTHQDLGLTHQGSLIISFEE